MKKKKRQPPKFEFVHMTPAYYGQYGNVMLEGFPAMDEVLDRLSNLPTKEEKAAWGHFMAIVVARLLGEAGELG